VMKITGWIRDRYHLLESRKTRKYIDRLVENGLRLGKNVAIVDRFFLDPSHCFLISIGDNCTICPNVRLIAHDASTKLSQPGILQRSYHQLMSILRRLKLSAAQRQYSLKNTLSTNWMKPNERR